MGNITPYQPQGGASVALSNLITTSINTALLPDTHNSYDFGGNLMRWKDGYFAGQLTVWDLVVESGSSITLAGATFENQGHYTSINTNWMVKHDDQDTAFIGVYSEGLGVMTQANLVLDAQGSSLNLLKNSPSHPWSPGDSGVVNEGGNFGIMVQHADEISFLHYDELTKDAYGNVTYLSGLQTLGRFLDAGDETEFQIEHGTGDTASFFVDDHGDLRIIASGNRVGVGSPVHPEALFEVYGTAFAQLRLAYDGSNYAEFDVDSAGNLQIDATGNLIGLGGSVGIGTTTVPHGGIGHGMFAMDGPSAHADGPHLQYTTDQDNYPVLQQMNWRHNDINFAFDAYYDAGWKSSDATSNYRMFKNGDELRFDYSSGNAQGDAVSWSRGFDLDANGLFSIPNDLSVGGTATADDFVDSTSGLSVSTLAQNAQASGLLDGGLVTIASATTINISAGSGQIADFTTPTAPTTTGVSWSAISGYTPANLATDGQYIIAFNSVGSLVEFDVNAVTAQMLRDNIVVGGIGVFSSTIIAVVDSPLNVAVNGIGTAKDFIRDVIGPANIIGNLISANGVNLSIDNSGGVVFVTGSNFRNNPEVPDETTVSMASPMTFMRAFRETSPSSEITTDGAGPVTVLDPSKWDDGSGILQSLGPNNYTVQAVYIDPDGMYWVMFGQEVFSKLADAQSAVLNGTLFYEEYPTPRRFVRRCFIVVKSNATDLSDSSDAHFIADHKFRNGGLAVTGGIPGINSPGGADTNVQYNDAGAFGGSSDLAWDDAGKVLTVNGELAATTLTGDGSALTMGLDQYRIPYGNIDGSLQSNSGFWYDGADFYCLGTGNPYFVKSGNQKLYVQSTTDANALVSLWTGASGGLQKGVMGYNSTDDCLVLAHSETGVTASSDGIRIKEGKFGIGATPTWDFHLEKSKMGTISALMYNSSPTDAIMDFMVLGNGAGDLHLVSNNGPGLFYGVPSGSPGIAVTEGNLLSITVGDSGLATEMMGFDASTGIVSVTADLNMASGKVIDFPDETGVKLDLHGGNYAIGVESSELRIASNEDIIFYTSGYTGTEVARIEADGMMKVTGGVRAPEVWSTGILKLQPDVQGNVELFGDTDVGNAENGKMLYVRRQAAEGNNYMRFYITASRDAMIHSNADLTMQGQSLFTINSVDDSIIFKLGDTAGAEKVYFRDKDANDMGSVDSDGNAWFDGTLAVGIGSPDYTCHMAQLDSDAILTLERVGAIVGMGYGIGGVYFKGGETTPAEVARVRVIATEDWTSTSSPTRMEFHTTRSGLATATHSVTIDENGNLGVGVADPQATVDVDGGISVADAIVFQDGSTKAFETNPFTWHIVNSQYRNTKNITAEVDGPCGIFFKPDGTRCFVVDNQLDTVFEYDLSTPWDISTITYNSVSYITSGSSAPQGIFFRHDGKKMYLADPGDDEVNEYDLAVAWDLSFSVTLAGTKSLPSTTLVGIFFRPDGRRMYVSDAATNDVKQYTLTIPWDVTTASWDQTYGTDIDAIEDLSFSSDGRKMFIIDGSAEDDLHEFRLTTPWDISTASLHSLFSLWRDTVPIGLAFSPDGSKMYFTGNANDSIYEYDVGVTIPRGSVTIGHDSQAGSSRLEVWDGDDHQIMAHDSRSQAADVGGGIGLGGHFTDAGALALGSRIRASKVNGVSGEYGFDLSFSVIQNGGTLDERMRLFSDGGVQLVADSDNTLHLNRDSDSEDGSAMAKILFGCRTNPSLQQKGAIIFQRTASYGRGDLLLCVNGGANNDDADDGNAVLTLSSATATFDVDAVLNNDLKVLGDVEVVGGIGIGTDTPMEEFHIKSDHPTITFEEQDGASNEKVWELGASGDEFVFKTANDAHTGTSTIWKAHGRGGTAVSEFSIPNARVGIGVDGPATSAALEIKSTTGALLVPRMTTSQRTALTAVNGMIIYDTGQNEFRKYENGGWAPL